MNSAQPRKKSTATLLALFLGGIGGHKFYLGQTGQGFAYLLLFWTFIPAICALIEIFMLISMDDEKFNSKFNKGIQQRSDTKSTTENLVALASLYEKNLLTKEEFEAKKAQMLDKIS